MFVAWAVIASSVELSHCNTYILCIMFHLQELGNKSEQTAQGLRNLHTSTVTVMENLSVCLLSMISSAVYMFVHLKNY